MSPLIFGPTLAAVAVAGAWAMYLAGRISFEAFTYNILSAVFLGVAGSAMAMHVVLWKWK